MNIAETYSHLNGLEYLIVHKKPLWEEILSVIDSVDARHCRTKISKERTKKGQTLYNPSEMNKCFKNSSTIIRGKVEG